MIELDFECICKNCNILETCPIGRRPLGFSFHNDEVKFTCENLVELFELFKLIGGMAREYKENNKTDPQ